MIITIEILIAIIAIVINIIIFHKKSIKKTILISILIILALIIACLITFVEEKPQIDTNEIIEIEAKTGERLKKPKTTYIFHDVTSSVKIIGNIDYNKIGRYEIKYEVPTVLGKYSKSQIVDVVDKIAPEIKLQGEEVINQSYKSEFEEPGVTAIDNYDGDITSKIITEKNQINENQIEIKYTVTDMSGNTTSKTRKVNLIDDVPPTITLNGDTDVSVIVGNQYKEQGAKATDEKDGDLTSKVQIESNVNTSKTGKYIVTYKVSDNSGNEAIKTRNVSVVEKIEQPKPTTNENKGKSGVIYLTFDDGPSSSITPKILDILKKKNIKATFFILNYDSVGEKLVQREINEGHTVAIHGYSHNYKTIYTSVNTYMENITKLQAKIKNSTGYNSTITRFPGGSSNTVSRYNPGIMTKLTKEVVSRGYKYFDWNVSSGDAGEAKTSQDVYNTVTRGLKKSRANIVLMHDFSGNTKTLNALENIINYGINNGYTFDKITESTPMVTHSVNN
jgi:peptidoglycan/xylan/chitin deacetylase (PgdA/CDA1 family)